MMASGKIPMSMSTPGPITGGPSATGPATAGEGSTASAGAAGGTKGGAAGTFLPRVSAEGSAPDPLALGSITTSSSPGVENTNGPLGNPSVHAGKAGGAGFGVAFGVAVGAFGAAADVAAFGAAVMPDSLVVVLAGALGTSAAGASGSIADGLRHWPGTRV